MTIRPFRVQVSLATYRLQSVFGSAAAQSHFAGAIGDAQGCHHATAAGPDNRRARGDSRAR
jgi:hypothetical protein